MPQILLKRKRRAVIPYDIDDLEPPEEVYDYKFDESIFEESTRNGISEFHDDYLDGTAVDPNGKLAGNDFDELKYDEDDDEEENSDDDEDLYDENDLKLKFSPKEEKDDEKFKTY